MVGWHHRLNGHESEQALGGGEGQGSPACCGPWGGTESDTTEGQNNNLYLKPPPHALPALGVGFVRVWCPPRSIVRVSQGPPA